MKRSSFSVLRSPGLSAARLWRAVIVTLPTATVVCPWSGARAQVVPTPVATAVSDTDSVPSPLLPRPATTHVVNGVTFNDNSFEGPTDANGNLLPLNSAIVPGTGGVTYPPGSTTWTWSGAGIAGRSASIDANQPMPTPDGDFVLFLQSSTAPVSVTIPFAFPTSASTSPNWRFSFKAAQRAGSPTFDKQVVRIDVTFGSSTVMVFNDVVRDDVYRRHVTRPFAAPASTSTSTSTGSITISGTATLGSASPQVALLDLLELREVLDFASASTWVNGAVPAQSQFARIPAISCVGVRSVAVNVLDVVGELLVLKDPNPGAVYTLSTRSLNVRSEAGQLQTGLFQVGTEGVPYENRSRPRRRHAIRIAADFAGRQ